MKSFIVVGGGPAGSSLAIRLAQAGLSVSLIEREAGPHDKVCGEFLSFEAVGYLKGVGLDPTALGGVDIEAVEICRGTRSVTAALPFRAVSLGRRVMDEALLSRAKAVGVRVLRGARVTQIGRLETGWHCQTNTGDIHRADHIFLATGKHDIRRWSRPPGSQADLLGFKAYWTLNLEEETSPARVELHLFPGGYAGLQRVGDSQVNLCLLVRKKTFRALGGDWTSLLRHILNASPKLADTLRHANGCNAKPLAIGAIPYGHVQRKNDGLWRLGDQGAVIPSFAGEGMSIAMHSSRLAAEVVLSGGTAEDYQRRLAQDVSRQINRATRVSQALVRPLGQSLILGIASAKPTLVGMVAGLTRITDRALRETPRPATATGIAQRAGPVLAPKPSSR